MKRFILFSSIGAILAIMGFPIFAQDGFSIKNMVILLLCVVAVGILYDKE